MVILLWAHLAHRRPTLVWRISSDTSSAFSMWHVDLVSSLLSPLPSLCPGSTHTAPSLCKWQSWPWWSFSKELEIAFTLTVHFKRPGHIWFCETSKQLLHSSSLLCPAFQSQSSLWISFISFACLLSNNDSLEAGEMAQLVKHLQYKHEVLSSISATHIEARCSL